MDIDHLTVFVRSYDASKRLYEEILEPLGFRVLLDWPDKRRAYLGRPGEPSSLWLVESELGGRLEIALPAVDTGAVHSFYGTAVSSGARADWQPGIRPEYGREYYSARVYDFDGNALEVVYRGAAAQVAA